MCVESHSDLNTRTSGRPIDTCDFADLDLQVSAQRTVCVLPDQSPVLLECSLTLPACRP